MNTTPPSQQYIRIEGKSYPINRISGCRFFPESGYLALEHVNGSVENLFIGKEPSDLQRGSALQNTIKDAINARHHINEPAKVPVVKDSLTAQPKKLVRVGRDVSFNAEDVVSVRLNEEHIIVFLRGDLKEAFNMIEFDDKNDAKTAYNQALADWSGSEEYGV